MSEVTEDKKWSGGGVKQYPQRSTKNLKSNYDTKTYDEKDSGNTRRNEDSGTKRSNDNYYRQQNRQNDGQSYQNKNTGYNRNFKKAGNDYQSNNKRRKRETYNKIQWEDIFERREAKALPSKEFREIIEANLLIFSNDPLLAVNEVFDDFETHPDDCLSWKSIPMTNIQSVPDTQENQNQNQNQNFEREKRSFVDWDTGNGKDIFIELDSQKMDAELRGKKLLRNNGTESNKDPKAEEKKSKKKGPEPEKLSPVAVEEKKIEKKDEKKDEKIEDKIAQGDQGEEDEGEFSNIDKIFEEKLKANQLHFDVDDQDYGLLGEADLLQDDSLKQHEEDNAPVWEEFNVDEIKKSAAKMEGLFVDNVSNSQKKQLYSAYGSDVLKEERSFDSGDINKDQFDNHYNPLSTPFSRELTPKSDASWDPYLPQQQLYQKQQAQQQQQYYKQNSGKPMEGYDHSYMSQGIPINNPNKTQVGGNRNMANNPNYYQAQQQPSMVVNNNQLHQQVYQQFPTKQQQTPSNMNSASIGLSKQIPSAQIKVFKFICRDDYDKKQWYYKDPQQNIQGPFSTRDMDEWYEAKLLPSNLLITYGENTGFKTLSELVQYVDTNSAKMMQQQQPIQQQPIKQQGINLANVTYQQMLEWIKNPEFIKYAQSVGMNVNQVLNNLKEREQEKYYAMNKDAGYKPNQAYNYPSNSTFEGQGGYYPNGGQNHYGKNFGGNQPVNKAGYGSSQIITLQNQIGGNNGGSDYNYNNRPGMYQSFNNPDNNKMTNSFNNTTNNPTFKPQTNKVYNNQFQQPQQMQPMYTQQQPQYSSNQDYPTSVYLNNAIPQNTTIKPQQQQSTVSYPQNESNDLMTNQLKSMLGLGLGGVIGGFDSQKSNEGQGVRFNSSDFPSIGENYK